MMMLTVFYSIQKLRITLFERHKLNKMSLHVPSIAPVKLYENNRFCTGQKVLNHTIKHILLIKTSNATLVITGVTTADNGVHLFQITLSRSKRQAKTEVNAGFVLAII